MVAVCDADPEKELAYLNVPVFSDYRELIDKVDLDVVFACAYNNANSEIYSPGAEKRQACLLRKTTGEKRR